MRLSPDPLTFNQQATGSIPVAPTNDFNKLTSNCLATYHIKKAIRRFLVQIVSKSFQLRPRGKLLGHTQGQTTSSYAHPAVDPIKAAAEGYRVASLPS